ncbi:hypothetical protein ACQUFY_27845 (plasmid) [Robbsia andropogonis]|uniref:OspG family effector kinase n=1 Tax=Robbsia andropogonis TaxID=28092 RepID=UPI003D21F647
MECSSVCLIRYPTGKNILNPLTYLHKNHADHPEFVIKRYCQAEDDPDDEIHLPHREEETFRRFYGADAAQRYEEADGTQYLRMYRIPGMLLDDLQPNSLPEDALERYVGGASGNGNKAR